MATAEFTTRRGQFGYRAASAYEVATFGIPDAPGSLLVEWTLTSANDTGRPFAAPGYQIQSVQFSGTFGGATVLLEGSNARHDGSPEYTQLTDPQGNNIEATAEEIEQVQEHVHLIRPRITTGATGTTSITVQMLLQKQRS